MSRIQDNFTFTRTQFISVLVFSVVSTDIRIDFMDHMTFISKLVYLDRSNSFGTKKIEKQSRIQSNYSSVKSEEICERLIIKYGNIRFFPSTKKCSVLTNYMSCLKSATKY